MLGQIGKGDLESLGALFDRYAADVRRFLLRLGTSRADVDDLVQLTFLEVSRAARSFDGRISARPWLFGVAATIARRHRRSLSKMLGRLPEFAMLFRSREPETPADSLSGKQAEERVARALAALSEKKREVFVMVILEGASGEEAALSLGIPVNTVWTRLHHARRELREHLFEEGS